MPNTNKNGAAKQAAPKGGAIALESRELQAFGGIDFVALVTMCKQICSLVNQVPFGASEGEAPAAKPLTQKQLQAIAGIDVVKVVGVAKKVCAIVNKLPLGAAEGEALMAPGGLTEADLKQLKAIDFGMAFKLFAIYSAVSGLAAGVKTGESVTSDPVPVSIRGKRFTVQVVLTAEQKLPAA